MASRTEELNRVLKGLQSGTPEIEGTALVSEDGLMIGSALSQNIEEVRVAGMSSTLLSLGTRAAMELGRGNVDQVLIKGTEGYVIMMGAAPGTLLMALTTKNAKLGLMFLDMARAAEQIKKIL